MGKYRFDDIAFNSTAKKKPVEEDKYTYIGLEHLDSGNLQVTRFGSEIAPKGEKLIMKKGDILFGKRRAYQKKVAIAPFDGIFSAHGMVLRPKENVINKDYFPFFISSDYFLDAAIKISVGSLSPTINWGDLKELEFELPDMAEQERLAKILWAAEDLKRKYNEQIDKAIRLKNSIYNHYFSFNFDESRRLDNTEWSCTTLGELGEFKTSSVDKKIRANEKLVKLINYMDVYQHKNIRMIDYESFMEVSANEKQIKNNNLLKGDILFTPSSETPNDIGHSIVIHEDMYNVLYSYHLVRFRLYELDKFDLNFLNYFCNAPIVMKQFEKLCNGLTRFTLKINDFESVKVVFPNNKDYQFKIALKLMKIDKLLNGYSFIIDSLKTMVKSLVNSKG